MNLIKLRLRLRVATIKKASCARLRVRRDFGLRSCGCGNSKQVVSHALVLYVESSCLYWNFENELCFLEIYQSSQIHPTVVPKSSQSHHKTSPNSSQSHPKVISKSSQSHTYVDSRLQRSRQVIKALSNMHDTYALSFVPYTYSYHS